MLALSCDDRIATPQSQLCLEESALGLVPDLTGTKPLVEIVGCSRALDVAATARVVDGTAPVHGAVVGVKHLVQHASEQDLEAQREDGRRAQVGRLREMAALLDS